MLSNHETKAFQHPRILDFHKFFSEYHVWFEVGPERFRITIRVYETSDGRFCFVQSHSIKTPLQDAGPFLHNQTHEHPHDALSAAIDSVTVFYDRAVDEGHEPNFGWFRPNDAF